MHGRTRIKGRAEERGRVDGALDRLKTRFEDWRRRRVKGAAIPTELMEAAKGLVGRYPPGALAKALRLHYWRLVGTPGARVEGRGRRIQDRRERRRKWNEERPTPPTFVRVPIGVPATTTSDPAAEGAGCVELETPRGFKARVWYGRAPSGLVNEVMKGMIEGWR